MSTKDPIESKIPATAFIVAIITITASFYKYGESHTTRTIKSLIEPLNLSWFDEGWGYFLGYSVNYFHLFFGLLLLIGAGIYVATKHREATLIRFVFSVMFLSRIVSVVFGIIHWMFLREKEYQLTDHLTAVCFMAICAGYLILFYKIITYFNRVNLPETISYGDGDAIFTNVVTLPKGARLFNFMVDNLIAVLLFSPIVWAFASVGRQLGGNSLFVTSIAQAKAILYFLIFCFGTTYFFLSEWLLGTSPGKFLTGARVTNDLGEPLPAGQIFKRTMCRFIPFDGLSFVFSRGWHDTISQTNVAKEKDAGFNKGVYFAIIPLAIIIGYVGSLANVQVKANIEEHAIVDKTELERKNFATELNLLDAKDILALKYKDDFSSRVRMFLKVEQVSSTDITFAKISRGEEPIKNQQSIEQLYKQQKDTLKHITLSKTQLAVAFRPESANADTGAPLKIDGEVYVVSEIKHCFAPSIKLEYAKVSDNQLVLALRNLGWQASLIDVNVIEGDVKILSKLPVVFYKDSYQPNMLYGQGNSAAFKMDLTVIDSLGGRQIYRLSGNEDNSKPVTIIKLR